ncbi:caspase-8 isoform X1 [Hydra vulgaris]|uniref:caspase-8 isoform X1 n=1 Tax=Hydra vulgaris TaxID=6087 RepID=UPI001F5F832D|nr:caspase-8 [Hydra vulgaris]
MAHNTSDSSSYTFLADLGDQLTKDNLKSLKFLLRDRKVPDGVREGIKDAQSYFETLIDRNIINENNLSYLVASFKTIKRNDLAIKVDEFAKKNVKLEEKNEPENITYGNVTSPFTLLLTELGDELKVVDLKKLKFLLKGTVPDGLIEEINDYTTYFSTLKHKNLIHEKDLTYLSLWFRSIGRIDLEKRVHDFVKKSSKSIEADNRISSYIFNQNLCGTCLIINNSFSNNLITKDGIELNKRNGTDKDVEELKKTFSWLNFEIVLHEDVDAKSMLNIIRSQGKAIDCFICCILSHGYKDGVYCSDGEKVSFEEMKTSINGKFCDLLIGKPKLFFIQACQDNESIDENIADELDKKMTLQISIQEENDIYKEKVTPSVKDAALNQCEIEKLVIKNVRDAATNQCQMGKNRKQLHEDADFCFFISATPGSPSCRNTDTGSWYIQTLCQILKKHSENKSLTDMLVKVNKKISKKQELFQDGELAIQVSNIRILSLRWPLYFKPKGTYIE